VFELEKEGHVGQRVRVRLEIKHATTIIIMSLSYHRFSLPWHFSS
jgi:hypothetical protein